MKFFLLILFFPFILSASPLKDKDQVVLIGDSITYRNNWEQIFEGKLINRGVDGDTTDDVLRRIQRSRPKKVFIMIGINDFYKGKSVDYVFNNYKKILNYYEKQNIPVVIQSTLFIYDIPKLKQINKNVKELNAKLENYATKNSLKFIDLNKILAPSESLLAIYTNDGLHLKKAAYQIWQKIIKENL